MFSFLGGALVMSAVSPSRLHVAVCRAFAVVSAVTALMLWVQWVGCGIVGLLLSAALCAAALATRPAAPDTLPAVMEANVAKMAGVASEVTIDGKAASGLVQGEAKRVSKCVRKWVTLAKLRWGYLADTRADRTCLARWLSEEMVKEGPDQEKDMRHKDRLQVVALAVEMFFVPTAEELVAGAVRRSAVVRGLKSLSHSLAE